MSAELLLREHPFVTQPALVTVRPKQTLLCMLLEASQGMELRTSLAVAINGHDVPRHLWGKVTPKPGTLIEVTAMPMGGGGGSKILRTVLMVALAAVALPLGGYMAGALGFAKAGAIAMAFGAGISMLGMLAINALIPPPKPPSMERGETARLNMLTGSSNAFNPYGVIPCVIGETKLFPPHAAKPYSESMGNVQYQHCLFDLGYGDLEVSDIRIGDTPISNYTEVEWEITKNPTLYRDDVEELQVGASMNDGQTASRTTPPDIEEITLDVAFPAGLFGTDKKGKLKQAVANITIEYRPVGGAWVTAPTAGTVTGGVSARTASFKAFTANVPYTVQTTDRKPFIASYAWGVPKGQYEVRLTRSATNWNGADENARVGDATWTVLRSIKKRDPSTTGTNKLAVRIKATDQLNGTLQTVNCIAKQKVKRWQSGAWSAPVATANTAWVVYWLLTQCEAVAKRVPESRIDLQSFIDFAAFCDTHELQTRGTLDASRTLGDLVREILSNSLGGLVMRDGKYGVIFDAGQQVPVTMLTPLDTKGFSVSRVFTQLPEALRVQFRNPLANWEEDEIVIPNDGFSWKGKDARGNASSAPEASRFETLKLNWSADPHSAWRIGRMNMAQAKFRPNSYSIETDIANIVFTRGDAVLMQHDTPEWGTGFGQVVDSDAGYFVIDNLVETEAGKQYSVRLRRSDGTTAVYDVTPDALETARFSFGGTASVGDIAVIGVKTMETHSLLITGVRPAGNFDATIEAVDFSPDVFGYWQNPPADIVSELSGTLFKDEPLPPQITVVISDPVNSTPDDAGITEPEVHVNVQQPPSYLDFRKPHWDFRQEQ